MPQGRASSTDDYQKVELSRRALLAASAGAAGMFAGCASDDTSDVLTTTTTTSEDGTTTKSDETSTTAAAIDPVVNTYGDSQFNPKEWNANPFNPQSSRGTFLFSSLWTDPLIQRAHKGENPLIALEDYTLESNGCVQVYTFRDDLYWWDGTPVTAQDFKTQRLLNHYLAVTSKDEVKPEYELDGKYTLRQKRATPINPSLGAPVNEFIARKHDFWKPWLEKYESATTEDEWTKVTKELQDYQFGIDTKVKEGLGNGLWKITDWTDIEMTMKVHDKHFRSDWTNIEEWHNKWMPDQTKRQQGAKNDRIDLGGKAYPNNDIEKFMAVDLPGCRAVYFSTRNKHIARTPVRQAIAFLANHKEIEAIFKSTFDKNVEPPFRQTGMTKAAGFSWLGKDWMAENLIDYGATSQVEKAAERMRAAGYTKDGDVWVGPDGDPAKGIKWVVPSHPHLKALTNYLSSKMNEFGIKTDVMFTTWAQYFKTRDQSKDFDILDGWLAGSLPQVVLYNFTLGEYLQTADPKVVEPAPKPKGGCAPTDVGTPELLMDRGPTFKFPIRDKYPTEPKAMEISGDGKTLMPVKWYRIMEQTQSKEEVVKYAREIAKYINYSAIKLEYYHEIFEHTMDTKHFEVSRPDRDEKWVKHYTWLMRGMLRGKTEQ